MMQALKSLKRRQFMTAAVGASGLFVLGCSPEYNWRELRVAEGRAVVAFPARVQTETRSLKIEGENLSFSLTSAAVKQNLFAVGFAALPAALTQARQEAIKLALLNMLAANLGASLPAVAMQGEPFMLESSSTRPIRMVARVLIHRGYLLEFIATGSPDELSPELTTEFMRSISLR